MNRILVVDDDPFFLEFVRSTLTKFEVDTAENKKQTLDKLAHQQYDLFMIDTQLGDDPHGGYSLCKSIRRQHSDTPVVFASSCTDLETRLQAYQAGANDYIAKPCHSTELEYKLASLLSVHGRQTHLQSQLESELLRNQSLINTLQLENFQLQSINRFLLACQGSRDLNTLLHSFELTLRDFGTCGVLKLPNEDRVQGCDCTPTSVELEILEMGSELPRIYHFGNKRAIFSWSNARLLVRDLGSLVDTIAILMDSLEIALETRGFEQALLSQMDELEHCNQASRQRTSQLVAEMTVELQDNLVTLGLVSSLSEEEEREINTLLLRYGEEINGVLLQQTQQSHSLRQLIDTFKTPDAPAQAVNTEVSVELF